MLKAISAPVTQKLARETGLVGPDSSRLDVDRHNLKLWAPKALNYGSDLPLLVGFDSEWATKAGVNQILSYQYCAYDFVGGPWHGIYYPDGTRYSLTSLLSCIILQGLQQHHIRKWPGTVILLTHFSLADLTTLTSFKQLKKLFDAVRRTFVSVKDSVTCKLWDLHRHGHKVTVILRDTMLLSPNGKQSLADLGHLVGCEKFELEDDEIQNMDALLVDNPERFQSYAERDPEICVKYALKMLELNHEITGKAEIPPTLSGIGLSFLLRLWRERGIDRHAVLGTEVVKESPWSPRLQRSVRRREVVPLAERHLFESFTSECFHGGRNEQYLFGAGEPGRWTDWDLVGAYTSAMCLIGLPDWKAIRQTRDQDDFQPGTLGYGRVRFRFPDNTRFPCLPVRTHAGLVFPLTGENFCGAPEIYLAQRLGAQLEILNGIVLPASFEVRPFEAFVIECAARRKSFTKGSLDELLWKEIGNSTYGKTAQGLGRKRVFDSRSGQHIDLPPSVITNPFFAAYTTSFVRAVLGEILAGLPLHTTVCNATTDGFLTNATDADVLAATGGPLCRLFAQARLRICGNSKVVECKHRIAQPLGWRTRGQATLKEIDGENPILAKAGLKPPMKDKEQHNTWIVDSFINRTAETTQTISTLRNLPEIWRHGGDLVQKEVVRRLSMDFDFKRRAVNPSTRAIKGAEHLYFETVPWRSIEEFTNCRERWEQFRSSTGTVLKTINDLAQFEDYRAVNIPTGLKRCKKDASVTIAKRMFLRAYTRSAWGLNSSEMSYAELARWLTDRGYITKKADVENAKRTNAKLVQYVTHYTPAVQKLVGLIIGRFPSFRAEELIIKTEIPYE